MLNKKTIKIFKVIAASTGVLSISSLSVTAISCGHKSSPPSKVENTWEKFKTSALAETPRKILEATKPVGWASVSDADLSVSDVHSDSSAHTVTLKINATSLLQEASFSIKYEDNTAYDYKLWTCTAQPDSKGWNTFKALAKAITAKDLLSQARSSKAIDKFSWPYGNEDEVKWKASEGAVFDTTQGTIKGSSDPFKGMQGAPKIDENSHSITAIFCKSVADTPDFSLDPIKAVITYSKVNQAYDVKDWKFSATKQAQAQDKAAASGVTTGWEDAKAKKWDKFESENWFYLAGGDVGENIRQQHHETTGTVGKSPNLKNALEHNGLEDINTAAGSTFGYIDGSKSIFDIYTLDGNRQANGKVTWVQLSFRAEKAHIKGFNNYSVKLSANFLWVNGKDNTGGGFAYAQVWDITDIQITG